MSKGIESAATPFALATVATLAASIIAHSMNAAQAAKVLTGCALGMSIAGIIGALALGVFGVCCACGGMLTHSDPDQMTRRGLRDVGGAFALGTASFLTLTVLGIRSLVGVV